MRIIFVIGGFLALLTVVLPLPAFATQSTGTGQMTPFRPKRIEPRDGVFHCDTLPNLMVGRSLVKTGPAAFAGLQTWLSKQFGSDVVAVPAKSALPTSPTLLVGLENDHAMLKQLVAQHRGELSDGKLGPEGYLLDVTPQRILIAAQKPAGAFYGVLKLMELNTSAKGLIVAGTTLVDWPTMPWRGMHLIVNSHEDMPTLEALIGEYLPRYRLNKLILEINYHFQFTSHPEVAEGNPLTKVDCQQLKQLADKSFIELVPMINCLGHQSWAEHTAQLLTAHPEFDETPNVPKDNKGIYCRSWCPSNPDCTNLVCDLADELIAAFDAHSFHVGMDEVFLLGECPRCKGQDNAKLFAKAVNTLHAHLVGKRKVQMMMWGDRLLDGKATGYGEWEASKNGTEAAIDLIPKDIVLCDWHYETSYNHAPATYPSVAYFQKKGFRVWPSSWRSVENARMLAACSLQNLSPKMVGYLATTWVGAQNILAGLTAETPSPSNKQGNGVVHALKVGSEIAWEGDLTKPAP